MITIVLAIIIALLLLPIIGGVLFIIYVGLCKLFFYELPKWLEAQYDSIQRFIAKFR